MRSDPKEKNTVTLRGIAWKAILSEAVVTEGEALGISMLNSCLEGSTSYQTKYIARYCLTDSSPHASNPGTVSRVTTALLSTALQAGRDIFFLRQQREKREREEVTLYQLTSKRVDGLIDFHCICFLCKDSVGIGTIRNY